MTKSTPSLSVGFFEAFQSFNARTSIFGSFTSFRSRRASSTRSAEMDTQTCFLRPQRQLLWMMPASWRPLPMPAPSQSAKPARDPLASVFSWRMAA